MSQVIKFLCLFINAGIVISGFAGPARRGELVSAERLILWELSLKAINTQKAQMRVDTEEFPTLSRVEIYRIRYGTVNQRQEPVETTGIVAFPADVHEALPFLSYQHATRMQKIEAPSALPVDPEMDANSILHASSSFIVTMADYLGLDKINDSPQFYLNSEIQSRVAYDLMVASKQFFRKIRRPYINDVYIAGYSQGAHNALALHKYIQERHSKHMRVMGTAAMSGAYGISSLARQIFDEEVKVRINPVFVGLAIFGMHEAYADFPRLTELLREPYSESLPKLLRDGRFSAVRKALPDDPDEFLNLPRIMEIIDEDDTHPFWQALLKNDVDNFVPNAPVLMIHSPDDKVIPFSVAEESYKRLKDLGAEAALLEIDGINADHVDAAYPAFMNTARFFKALREEE